MDSVWDFILRQFEQFFEKSSESCRDAHCNSLHLSTVERCVVGVVNRKMFRFQGHSCIFTKTYLLMCSEPINSRSVSKSKCKSGCFSLSLSSLSSPFPLCTGYPGSLQSSISHLQNPLCDHPACNFPFFNWDSTRPLL